MAYEQRIDRFYRGGMVGLGRLELPTSRLSGVRSNQTELQALWHSRRFMHHRHRTGMRADTVSRVRHSRWKGYAGGDARHLLSNAGIGVETLTPTSLERR
jgi:hypothetical protein